MKTFKKVLTILLSLVIALPLFTSCKDKEHNDSGVIQETDIDLVKDGASSYKIVLSDAPRGYEAHAAQELALNFYNATMEELETVSESAVTVNADSKLLIIGETQLTEAAGVTADKAEYGARGFVIKQKDSNVYMLGGDTMGTLYAVYEFLHHQFGYEPYAMDEIALETGVTDKKLLAFDISDIPDIAHTQGIGPYFWDKNILAGHRMRYNVFDEVFVNATGQPWHNTFEYISPAEYNDPNKPETYHPKWFAPSGQQLHYTAYGDEEELKALQDLVLEKMIYFIERDFAQGKYYEYIGFMAEDYDNSFPTSDDPFREEGKEDSVAALREKYGTAYASAMLIQFINPIAERLQQYMDEYQDGRNMNITIFAYLETEPAPVKTENGKIVPIDGDVVLEPNVNVLVAPIRASYIVDFDETGMNGLIDEWSAITSQFSFWFYDYYFQNTFIYMDSTYSLQSFYQAAKEANAKYVFNESATEEYCSPFGTLKIYLTSKLTWDVNADVDALIDGFFENYFKQAAVYVRQYFEELRTYMAYLKSNSAITGVGGSDANLKQYWEEGALNRFMSLLDQAFEAIEPLKFTDRELYETLYDRVTRESLMPRYLLLQHYPTQFDSVTLARESEEFFSDCERLGITRYGILENQTVSSLVFG